MEFTYQNHAVEIKAADGYAEEGQTNRGQYDVFVDDEFAFESVTGLVQAEALVRTYIDAQERQ